MEETEYSRMFIQEGNFCWYVSLHEITAYSIRRQFKEKKSLRILDAVCGTGRMLELASEFGKTYGIDFSKDAGSFCRKRGLKNVSQKNLNKWKPGATFDVIICNDVLYHSAIHNDKAVIEKFHKALVPGGILILHLEASDIPRQQNDNVVHGSRNTAENQYATC
jgi:2-polyprenyl-3-methyl-5-hydroxy-6-metoxy-1,4-benzoquinol methylase